MAGLGTRSRRNTQNNPSDEIESVNVKDNSRKAKSRNNSRIPRNLTTEIPQAPESPIEATVSELSAVETESGSTTGPSGTEEVSSNTSESGSRTSDKSSSETSVTSEETLNKTKDELIKQAHDLDFQFKELIKMYTIKIRKMILISLSQLIHFLVIKMKKRYLSINQFIY